MSYNGIEVVHVVAMDQNNCIGKQGKLPWHIKEDLQRFKDMTDGGIVVMGRKTYESIGQPLKNRVNIVVSHAQNFSASGLGVIGGSIESALIYAAQKAKELNKDQIFIIGGGEIYAQTMNIVDRIELTRIKTFVKDGDAFYPEIDCSNEGGIFALIDESLIRFNRFNYNFVTYARKVNTTVGKDDGEWCVVDGHGEIVYHGSSYDNAESWFYWNGGVERGYIVDELPVAAVANRDLSKKVIDVMIDALESQEPVELPDFDETEEELAEEAAAWRKEREPCRFDQLEVEPTNGWAVNNNTAFGKNAICPPDATHKRNNVDTPIFYKVTPESIKRYIKYNDSWVNANIGNWAEFCAENNVQEISKLILLGEEGGEPLTEDQIDFAFSDGSRFYGVKDCPHPFFDRGLCVDGKQQCFHCGEWVESGKLFDAPVQAKARQAHNIAEAALQHTKDRAITYDQANGERSAAKTAQAFNAITGKDLTESEVFLMLQLLKDVRQWSKIDYHKDSAEDCIAYAALKAEALERENQ